MRQSTNTMSRNSRVVKRIKEAAGNDLVRCGIAKKYLPILKKHGKKLSVLVYTLPFKSLGLLRNVLI